MTTCKLAIPSLVLVLIAAAVGCSKVGPATGKDSCGARKEGDGKLVDATANGAPDTFDGDPMKPVPSHGGGCYSSSPALDQSEIEKRKNVLVYSTERLSQPINLAGAITATLYFSTSVPDTDLAFKVVDVYPDGKAFNILDTIQRLQYRNGIDKESLLKPGETYRMVLGQMVIATRIGAGHKLRIEVAGSNFPLYERNMNTGGRNYDEARGAVAHNTIFHDGDHLSTLELPVVGANGS